MIDFKEIINKLKKYLDEKAIEEFERMHGHRREKLTVEDYESLLYFIEFGEEIVKEYGSYFKWRKILDKDGMKPYMYYIFKEQTNVYKLKI